LGKNNILKKSRPTLKRPRPTPETRNPDPKNKRKKRKKTGSRSESAPSETTGGEKKSKRDSSPKPTLPQARR